MYLCKKKFPDSQSWGSSPVVQNQTKSPFCTCMGHMAILTLPSRRKNGVRGTDVITAIRNNSLFLLPKPHFCFWVNISKYGYWKPIKDSLKRLQKY